MSNSAKANSEPNVKKISSWHSGKQKERFKLFLIALPFLCLVFLFAYLPLYGWLYAFYYYEPPLKLSQCTFAGLHWFQYLVSNTVQVKTILNVLRNTFAISGLGILTSWVPMVFAIFLTEIKSGKVRKVIQTCTTLPNFISWVLVYSIAYALFSYNGPINNLLTSMNIIPSNINWLAQDNHTWLAMTLWGMWKGTGWGAILYMAAIAGIDQELYEAAAVDGAGRFRMIWNITLPELLPTYFVLLVLSIANFLNNGFDQYYVFQNSFNQEHIQVLDLYVYNLGIGSSSFSLATAIGILKSFVSIVLLTLANRASKCIRGSTVI